MNRKNSFFTIVIGVIICCGLLSFLAFAATTTLQTDLKIKPRLEPANRKVILDPAGEVTSNVGYVGEPITYKIYYRNESKVTADIRIIDKLDNGLKNVSVKTPGTYNPSSNTIVWEFLKVAPGASRYVQFTGVLGQTGTIINSARIQFSVIGKLPGFDIKKPQIEDKSKILEPAVLSKQDLMLRPVTIETNKVTTTVYKQPTLGWIPFESGSTKGDLPKPTMKDASTIGTMVNFNIPGVFVKQVQNNRLSYQRFFMAGQASMTEIGKPELPLIGQVIEVPQGVNFSIEVIKTRLVSLDHYRVYPAQEPLVDVRKGDPLTTWGSDKFALDKTAYLSNKDYPGALAAIKTQDIGRIRGHRIVLLKFNPIQYNPKTHETKAYAQIEVRVKYSSLAQVTAIPKRLYSRHFEKYLKNLVLNYQDPKHFDQSIDVKTDDGGKELTGCDYLILTTNTFYTPNDPNNPVARLANWKARKGLRTKIVDTANITNSTTYDGIRQYLKNAYDNWNIVPAYVLLIGDANQIPVRYLTAHPSHNNTLTGTDLYYSTLDGDDLFPDIYLGRLPVETLAQATTAIDRIINYEQHPPAIANFYQNVMITGLYEDESGYPNDGTEDGTEDRPWIENLEDIRTFLLGQGYQADRIYTTSSGWPADPASDQPANYEDGTTLPAALQPPGFGWNGTSNDVSNGINNGRFLVTYRDHGSRGEWSATGFGNGAIDGLTNGNLTPVVFSIACQNGWFDNETDAASLGTGNNDECFSEHFVRNNNGGAVAIIGASRNSYTGPNDFLMFGLHKAIWPAYEPDPPISGYPAIPDMTSNQLLKMGQILNFGKVYMARAYDHDTYRTLEFEMYHLFGDPEMAIWTSAPVTFDVNYPAVIGSLGEQDFVVKVTNHNTHAAVQMSQVVLTRDNSVLAVKETDPAGIVRFKLNAPATGKIDITVTYQGYTPYLGQIEVSSGGATINRLDPDNGVTGQIIHIGGINFDNNENVTITFDGTVLSNTTASGDSFGQTTQPNVDITVPSPHDLGPVNVVASGNTSNRSAVDVFQVRSQNPIDLYIYDQWDSSTWGLHPGDNPTWDNPSIQLYDDANNPVASNNLKAGFTYTIKADVHNDTDYKAQHVKVTFKWANFGLGQPPETWSLIGTDEIDVPAHSVVQAEAKWTPAGTGHLCVMTEIYHIEDINTNNNNGQENCHIGPTSSPAKVDFVVYNPTKEPQMVYLELRQLIDPKQEGQTKLWGSYILHPDPQLLQPGEKRVATVVIDPDLMSSDIKSGQSAKFALTGYINGKMIGGVNFTITKK